MQPLSIIGNGNFLAVLALLVAFVIICFLVGKFSGHLKRQLAITGSVVAVCVILVFASKGLVLFFPPLWVVFPVSVIWFVAALVVFLYKKLFKNHQSTVPF